MYYLNTNAQCRLYQKVTKNEIFVDKSLMIEKVSQAVGTGSPYICITQPRRFGKTVNANMLGAYYTKGYDSHPIFEGLAVAGTKQYERDKGERRLLEEHAGSTAIILELKVDSTAEKVLAQIKEKNYMQRVKKMVRFC